VHQDQSRTARGNLLGYLGGVAQAGYVGTLVIRQFIQSDLNAGQVLGAGIGSYELDHVPDRDGAGPDDPGVECEFAVEFAAEIPRTSVGKFKKSVLRDQYRDRYQHT
jgi:hypothetical protein